MTTESGSSLNKEFRAFMDSDLYDQTKGSDKTFLEHLVRIQNETGQRKLTARQRNNLRRILREAGWYAAAN